MDHAAAPPAGLPRAPGPADRARLLAARLRTRGRVRAEPGVALGRGVRFDVAAGEVVLREGAVVGDRCRFHVRGGAVEIGGGTVLGERCAVVCHERVIVGSRCLLADEVVLTDVAQRADDPDVPVRLQGLRTAPVHIGDGARIGPGTALDPGARVEPGAVVAAHQAVQPSSRSRR